MAKFTGWDFEKDTIYIKDERKDAEREKAFSFKLTRYKDKNTHEESLRIESFYKGNENGYIDTHIYDLGADLKKLKRYGVAFERSVYMNLQKKIEEVYLSLDRVDPDENPNAPKHIDDSIMNEMISMIGDFAEQYELIDGCYHIPVENFNELIQESVYNEYNISEIKEWLKKYNYIKTGIGRYTNVKRIRNKATRVISVIKAKIDSYKEDNKIEESKE